MPILQVDDELALLQQLNSASDKLVVVDFAANWCGPCRKLTPFLEDLCKANPNSVFIKVDVDRASELASSFEVSTLPTIVFIKNSEVVDRIKGADKPGIESKLKIWATPLKKSKGPTPISKKSIPSTVSSYTSAKSTTSASKSAISETTTPEQPHPPTSTASGNNNHNVSAIPPPPPLPPPLFLTIPMQQQQDNSASLLPGPVTYSDNQSAASGIHVSEYLPNTAKDTGTSSGVTSSGIVQAFFAAPKPKVPQGVASTTFSYDDLNPSQAGTQSSTLTTPTSANKPNNPTKTSAPSRGGTSSSRMPSIRSQRAIRTSNIQNNRSRISTLPPEKKIIVTNSKIFKRPRPIKTPGAKPTILKKPSNVPINPVDRKQPMESKKTLPIPTTASIPTKIQPADPPLLKPLQIRLADGSKIIMDVDMSQPISSLRQIIINHRPEMANKDFTFMKLFPSRDVKNETMAIKDAKLINSIILQKYVT